MALSILKHIGQVIKENNVFFDSYAVNSVQLKDGQVISFDDNNEKKYEGISDNLGSAFYIRSNPVINYVDKNRRTSSLRPSNNAIKTCRLVAYSFNHNLDISSETLTNKLVNDLNRIMFKGITISKPVIVVKKSNNNYIDNFFDETKKNLDYGSSFICISVDFELSYYEPICDLCEDDNTPPESDCIKIKNIVDTIFDNKVNFVDNIFNAN